MGKEEKKESATGKYVYDKKSGKVVKISDEIVGLKKSERSHTDENSCESGTCGYNPALGCAGGTCPYSSNQ